MPLIDLTRRLLLGIILSSAPVAAITEVIEEKSKEKGGDGDGRPACFLKGTRIRTSAGEKRVEDLRVGDAVWTLDGSYKPVKWIGTRRYVRQNPKRRWQRSICPIRLSANAISDGVPRRDLYVSPAHSIYIDGAFIPMHYLVNGRSVTRAASMGADRIEYFHVELHTQDVIDAEGALMESFIPYDGTRECFSNFVEYERLYGVEQGPSAVPFATHVRYIGSRDRAKALARLLAPSVAGSRDPIQVAYLRIAERAKSRAALASH